MDVLENEIDQEMTEARKNRKRLISDQVSQLFLNKQTIYLDKLQELLDNVKTPPALHLVQALICVRNDLEQGFLDSTYLLNTRFIAVL